MKTLQKLFLIILLLFLAAAACVFYAFKVEPFRLKVQEYTLNGKQTDQEPVKIVQISDLHIKADFTSANLQKVVETVNRQNPDIVLFTGDLYDNYAQYNEDSAIIEQLHNIQARYAKIAIWGNRDYGGGAVRQYENIMDRSGFKLLKSGNWYITIDSGKKILFTGLDDSLLGKPYMPDSTKIYDADYEILLTHEPDAVDQYQGYTYDIALSGHSHGGQINIPFLPFVNEQAVSASSLSSKYTRGMYIFNEKNGQKLYVNTGIGTTHISARFGVVPQVALFYLYL